MYLCDRIRVYSYAFCKCEIWQDDQGERAAEAQLLTVVTLFIHLVPDIEMCTDTSRKTIRAKNFLK